MDREDIIDGLRAIELMCVIRVPYCPMAVSDIIDSAIELLKTQKPRVLTLEEVAEWDGAFLIESRVNGKLVWASWFAEFEHYGETLCRMLDIDAEVDARPKNAYGYLWRCWTARPTDEQREAVKWDG